MLLALIAGTNGQDRGYPARPEPDGLVSATERAHRVRDWRERASSRVGLNDRQHVTIEPARWRPAEAAPLVGDGTTVQPAKSYARWVDLMVDAELFAS